jgi:hypothetical protein
MHANHTYNLMAQTVEESKSHWRIKTTYMKDAKGCKECLVFWKKLEQDKENHVKELTRLIKKHI